MRVLQIALFALGCLAFVVYIVPGTSDFLWNDAVALLLVDVVCIMLWPARTQLGRGDKASAA
jgi:hypothetical protein